MLQLLVPNVDNEKIFEKSRKMLLTFGPVFAIIIHAP